jgi:signal transduction histidine kinase
MSNTRLLFGKTLALTARLTLAFCAVIIVMVLGNAGYSIFFVLQDARDTASKKVEKAVKLIGDDVGNIQKMNGNLTNTLAKDTNLLTPYDKKDRAAVGTFLKGVIDARNLVGFITIVDERGRVFYSSDTPSKFGDDIRSKSKGLDYVFTRMGSWSGYASFSPNYITLSYMVPIRVTSSVGGVLIVSQPINSEFLIGEVRKLEILPNYINNIDLVLYRSDSNRIVEVTTDLAMERNAFIGELNQVGAKAIPTTKNWIASLFHTAPGFEKAGRWWSPQFLTVRLDPHGPIVEQVGMILVSTTVSGTSDKLVSNLTLYGATASLALILSFLFAAGIGRSIATPMRLLSRRVQDLSAQKPNPTELVGASGEWLDLSDKIEGVIATLRANVQNLRGQLSKVSIEAEEKTEQAETTNNQFDALNRQVSTQAKQLSETTKQLNNANQQAVSLQHKLDAVLQSSTEGFLLLDQYGNVLSANPVFLNWMGTTEAEIAGRLCFDLIKKPGEPRGNDRQAARVFVKHSGDPGDLINQFYPEGVVYHRSQPKAVEVLAHLQPVGGEDTQIQAYIMVLRDKSLRSEIAQLRGEIVGMLSDSIRAPIVAAESRWASILRNAQDTMHPSVGQSLAELHTQYEHLLGIIDSLLMVYGGIMPTPVTTKESFAVSRLVADCLEEFAPLAREKQLHVDYKGVAGLPNISTNREAVKAVLHQLLEKMISLTENGGRVRVEVQMKNSELRMSVNSSGPPLPESEIVDMFVGFVPGKHSEDSYSSRLSMYLARNNVERLGGKVWAEAMANKGTVILFTVPA